MGKSCSPGCRLWCLWWRLFVLSCFPRNVLDEIWDLIESVSKGFPFLLFFFSLYWTPKRDVTPSRVHKQSTMSYSRVVNQYSIYRLNLVSRLPFVTVLQSISGRLPNRGRKKWDLIDEINMSKQSPLAPTTSAVGPCPINNQIRRMPRQWKFTQHYCTTRPPHIDWKSSADRRTMKDGW